MEATHAAEDVLVIGAGPAGIATAYALEKAGISYKVIDRAAIIGSTWANQYPSLQLNTSRFYSHMPEKRFPIAWGIFPTGKQYHDYLSDFVQEHDFKIELGVSVKRVSQAGKLWRVETDKGTWLYKVVIPATGVWANPIFPKIDGMEDFQGELYHAREFRNPQQVAGKRVLVVGNGPSGIDISVAAGEIAESYLAIRSGVKLLRKYPLGLPQHAWMLVADLMPKTWCRPFMKWINSLDFGDTSRYGLNPPEAGSGGMTAYRGDELLKAVKAGKVTPISAPTRFFEREIQFADGRCLPFDTVILATGYEPVLHQYLDIEMRYSEEAWQAASICDWETGENGQRGFPLRDTSQHPNGRQVAGYEGLYLVGTFYKGKGAMYNFNVEAQIAAEQISEYLRQ